MEVFKQNRTQLSDEERAKVMKAGAVWHHGPGGEATPAVWKTSDSSGETWYVCNTHRVYQKSRTLEGAIQHFAYVETTA